MVHGTGSWIGEGLGCGLTAGGTWITASWLATGVENREMMWSSFLERASWFSKTCTCLLVLMVSSSRSVDCGVDTLFYFPSQLFTVCYGFLGSTLSGHEIVYVKPSFHHSHVLWVSLDKGVKMVLQCCIEQKGRTIYPENNTTEPVHNRICIIPVNILHPRNLTQSQSRNLTSILRKAFSISPTNARLLFKLDKNLIQQG